MVHAPTGSLPSSIVAGASTGHRPLEDLLSVIIPIRNGAATIGRCLEAALASRHGNFEIVVVDDASADASVEVIGGYPCNLVRLAQHEGAARARNVGASRSRGRFLFFTDADCLLQQDTLVLAAAALAA